MESSLRDVLKDKAMQLSVRWLCVFHQHDLVRYALFGLSPLNYGTGLWKCYIALYFIIKISLVIYVFEASSFFTKWCNKWLKVRQHFELVSKFNVQLKIFESRHIKPRYSIKRQV